MTRPGAEQRTSLGAARHQLNCMKPQIASRAETTRATHDTFIGTLYGPIATLHRLITLKTCMIATQRKSTPKLLHKSSTSYLSPLHLECARVGAILYSVGLGTSLCLRNKLGDEGEEFHHFTARSTPARCCPRTRHVWGTRQSRQARQRAPTALLSERPPRR
jgi:hypothetical protein